MIQSAALLKDLKAQLKLVQADLRARADDQADRWGARLQEEYAEARTRERTGHSWVVWRDNEVDQAAVAWLIATTFVRFCEDNDLLSGARIDGQPVSVGWIAGPGDRTARAEENLTAYFRENPTHNRRDWLRQAFRVLAAQPAGKALVDEKHNLVWIADISAERASSLIDFWRATDAAGGLVHDFSDASLDTRFLGDLYQDLSDHARKTYALLQTPVFVEEFILDQTLTPALAEFGLDGIKLIDPTCGSGHFLLGAFERLVDQWQIDAPALDAKERVRRAMDSIHGVDLNPFAVAIARFRLSVAGLLAIGERSLVGVPNLGFHLAIGDSLLGEVGGAPQGLAFEGEEPETYLYDSEDLKEYAGILKHGQYHVVIGNPPYITVKDKALNALYRLSYKTAAGKYALSAPFMELFFRLAIKGGQGQGAGYVGQITSNSFMKREFGKTLIEDFLGGKDHRLWLENPVELSTVIDSSGAWLPGHNFDGTPTVIIVGRRRRTSSERVRVVMGVKDDPGKPVDPASGPVWLEIMSHLDDPGYSGEFVSVVDLKREVLNVHPWSLSGGGASELREAIEAASSGRLANASQSVGIMSFTLEDDVFVRPRRAFRRKQVDSIRAIVTGDQIRDWAQVGDDFSLFPYDADLRAVEVEADTSALRAMWPYRTNLAKSVMFGGKTKVQEGLRWSEFGRLTTSKLMSPLTIAFAEVATHNHFIFDRVGTLFNRPAPIIKLPESASDQDHIALTGLLNSSVVCFWLKQVCQKKGGDADIPWLRTYQFNGTKVGQIPMPSVVPVEIAKLLDDLTRTLNQWQPESVISSTLSEGGSLGDILMLAERRYEQIRQRIVFAQEELDWQTYRLYGLIDDDLTYKNADLDWLMLGQRAFELALARGGILSQEESEWFTRHGSTPDSVIPEHWPPAYRDLVQRRLNVIESQPDIGLLERPDFKRRWAAVAWEVKVMSAAKSAIVDRLESADLWRDGQGPIMRSVTDLADALKGDAVLRELAAVLARDFEADLAKVLTSLVTEEAVPYLAAHRYKEAGLEKFRAWQDVWDLQRHEDAGKSVDIPVPPKYCEKDFAHKIFWKARGKLDVPKERFILYPDLGREGDATVVLGWAGWDHKDQALALAREFPVQDALGADDELLTQMVAGLIELEPWVHQWHSEMDASFGVSPAEAITGVIDQQLGRLESTREEVTAWEPPAPMRGRRAKNS